MNVFGFGSISTPSRVRKRVDSTPEPSDALLVHKRMRMLGTDLSPSFDILGSPLLDASIASLDDPFYRSDLALSRGSSFTSSSRHASPSQRDNDIFTRTLRPLMRRSVSSASLGPSLSEPVYAEVSAKHYMRNPKFFLDYTPPASLAATEPAPKIDINVVTPEIPPPPTTLPNVSPRLIASSLSGVLFFTRGSRIHFKNMVTNEEVGQLCKMQERQGEFSAVACGTDGYPNVVAIGTTKGVIVVYEVQTKKRLMIWSGNPVTALAWNGKTLTVGYATGNICHFNTRITPLEKMKEQAKNVTRHHSAITSLEWNADADHLASADRKGLVYCWKVDATEPLVVGEFFYRRKKIKHAAAISIVTWCPWSPRTLVTADVKGVVQVWNINPYSKTSNALTPGKLETGAAITGIQWSSQCREFLTTHGNITPAEPPPPAPTKRPLHRELRNPPRAPSPDPLAVPPPVVTHSIATWQFASLRFVKSVELPPVQTPIGHSAVYSHNMKVVFEVPAERKIYTCEVWGRNKEMRRHSSLDCLIR